MFAALASWAVALPDFKGKHRVLKTLLRFADGRIVRSRYGVLMRVHAADYTNYACISGTFHRDYDDVFAEVSQLTPGMAFLDVGANAGLFSMVAIGRVGSDGVVIAFEPNLAVFKDLVDNATANGAKRFYPFNSAIGATTGVLRFSAGADTHTGAGHLSENGDVQVAVMSFEDQPLFGNLIGDRRILVKIDVEGAEALVIEGMASLLGQQRVETVIAEIDDKNLRARGSSAEALYARMEALGFVARRGLGSAPHFNEVFQRRG